MNPTDLPLPTEADVRAALCHVYDPEFGVSIEDLGLIYAVELAPAAAGVEAAITMTLTSMYCPAGEVILEGVRSAVEALPGVARASVELVWSPSWTPERLSARAREQLGWDAPRADA